jgi:patatin-related protein
VQTLKAFEVLMSQSIQYDQEIRFAVVMYGGVSLAIYMNGIAQELLSLVQSTAAGNSPGAKHARFDADDSSVAGTAAVYRKLGQMLSYSAGGANWSLLEDDPGIRTSAEKLAGEPIRTRFVVDVLSGTSAGGINNVFLAKALANDQDMRALKTLWVDEGDIGKLLNDAVSVRDLPQLTIQTRPRSLLNSERLFAKLLQALQNMDSESGDPLVDELELFISATDVRGSPVKLRLADKKVEERRHRNVFRMKFSTDPNSPNHDFTRQHNPLLAFAARCTSAFPFAFEPMTVQQAADVLQRFRLPISQKQLADQISNALKEAAATDVTRGSHIDPQTVSFTDGGYLDNKPFGYAIEGIGRRQASKPVKRKLVYIEPSPELMQPVKQGAPDALDNVRAALIGVPRYETIREDLQTVLLRNRIARRVDQIMDALDEDVDRARLHGTEHTAHYANQSLATMMSSSNLAYAGYYRLKIATTTDELARILGHKIGIDQNSDEYFATRAVVKAWRIAKYTMYDEDTTAAPRPSYNQYLLDYDYAYRIRRMNSIRARLDRVACGGDIANRVLDRTSWSSKSPANRFNDTMAAAINDVRWKLDEIYRNYINDCNHKALVEVVPEIPHEVLRDALTNLLDCSTEEDRIVYATTTLDAPDSLEAFMSPVAEKIKQASIKASAAIRALFDAPASNPEHQRVIDLLHFYYSRFEQYDQVAFSTEYASNIGAEREQIEVFRISPLDATALKEDPNRLAGLSLHHFGAFMDADWRRHDILWGRLDGAERLICALLPVDHKDPDEKKRRERLRKNLIREAHLAIMKEEMIGADRDAIITIMREVAVEEATRRKAVAKEKVRTQNSPDELRTLLNTVSADEGLYSYFGTSYKKKDAPDRVAVTRAAARGALIFGKILEDAADARHVSNAPFAWFIRFVRFGWGVVETAVPQSINRDVFHHIARLFFIFCGVLILLGVLIGADEARQLGMTWLLVGAVVVAIQTITENYLRGGSVFKHVLRVAAAALILIVVYFALDGIRRTLLEYDVQWTFLTTTRTPLIIASILVLMPVFVAAAFSAARRLRDVVRWRQRFTQ